MTTIKTYKDLWARLQQLEIAYANLRFDLEDMTKWDSDIVETILDSEQLLAESIELVQRQNMSKGPEQHNDDKPYGWEPHRPGDEPSFFD